ncbi:MAG TPA: alkyl sulfatase dimerization domain-containing protein [Aquabacterium sp.]|nr:alkyl sulfatase dimerization domain-containing protein [Aquabacterium sp.]
MNLRSLCRIGGWPLVATVLATLCACQPRGADVGSGGATLSSQGWHAEQTKALQRLTDTGPVDASRGLVARPEGQIKDSAGKLLWDHQAFAFIHGAAPDTVHPSLWRMAQLNNQAGLFEVTRGIWQLRGFDLANITLIQGQSGWIVVDAGTSKETAQAALAFARQHLGPHAVSGLIYTHSHVDHFGGSEGILSAQDAQQRHVPIIAPAGFMEEATSENVLMGSAMSRRAMYMYGTRLPRNAQGLVDNGLGKAVALGHIGLLPPTQVVTQAQESMTIDGVRFIFHNVPGSEAPSEFTFELPDLRAYCGAELMSHTLHNLYTLRGAKVRDAMKWAAYLDQALVHTAQSDVLFTQHHWPVWGHDQIQDFIIKQRDTYQFLHDQTVHWMNAGLQADEIAERIHLPQALQDDLNVHGYYGTVRHNVKAIYQYYLGWFDGHPADLDPLPPQEAALKYVALAGGQDKLVSAARQAYDKGDYRWAAELLKHAVLADAKDQAASALLAQSLEQLGYRSESAAWRNTYLSGAFELRHGAPESGMDKSAMLDLLNHTPIDRFLEAMASALDADKAEGVSMKINLVLPDLQETYQLDIHHSVLHHHHAPADPNAAATLTISHPLFVKLMVGQAGLKDLLTSDQVQVKGSHLQLGRFLSMLDKAPGNFPIVTR